MIGKTCRRVSQSGIEARLLWRSNVRRWRKLGNSRDWSPTKWPHSKAFQAKPVLSPNPCKYFLPQHCSSSISRSLCNRTPHTQLKTCLPCLLRTSERFRGLRNCRARRQYKALSPLWSSEELILLQECCDCQWTVSRLDSSKKAVIYRPIVHRRLYWRLWHSRWSKLHVAMITFALPPEDKLVKEVRLES